MTMMIVRLLTMLFVFSEGGEKLTKEIDNNSHHQNTQVSIDFGSLDGDPLKASPLTMTDQTRP